MSFLSWVRRDKSENQLHYMIQFIKQIPPVRSHLALKMLLTVKETKSCIISKRLLAKNIENYSWKGAG